MNFFNNLHPGYSILISLAILASCKPAARIQVLQPAQLIIPEHIQKIVLIDRSKPSNGFLSNIESLLTGEDYQQDKEGRTKAMNGLKDILANTPRFQTSLSGIELEGSSGGRSFMPPLPWYEIETILAKYNGDAVVAIEMFDSDIQSTTTSRIVKEKDKDGKEISKIVYEGKRKGKINLGWRFYDPKNRQIIDEFKDTDEIEISSSGAPSQALAISNLQKSYEIIRNLAATMGTKYGKRIAPVWITLARSYFKTVKDNNKEKFAQAARYADSGEWLKAETIWEKIAEGRSSSAGKATYNLAVAAEVNGQLNLALQLARDAYTQFNEKKAKSYIRILERRIIDQEEIQNQMHQSMKTNP